MKPLRSILAAGLALAAFSSPARAVTYQVFGDTTGSPKTNLLSKTGGKATTLAVSKTSTAYVYFGMSLPAPSGSNALTPPAPGSVTAARLVIYFPTVLKEGTIRVFASGSNGNPAGNGLPQGVFAETFTTKTQLSPAVGTPLNSLPNGVGVTKGLAKNFFIVDVTAEVQGWLSNPSSEFGFTFLSDLTVSATISAKEGSGSGYPVVLEVDVNPSGGPVAGTTGTFSDAVAGTTATFTGTATAPNFAGNLAGNVTGNVTGNITGSAASFTGNLAGDVTGNQGATVVATVGGATAASIATATFLANVATDTNGLFAIVKRDGVGGGFAAGPATFTATSTSPSLTLFRGGNQSTILNFSNNQDGSNSAKITLIGGITSTDSRLDFSGTRKFTFGVGSGARIGVNGSNPLSMFPNDYSGLDILGAQNAATMIRGTGSVGLFLENDANGQNNRTLALLNRNNVATFEWVDSANPADTTLTDVMAFDGSGNVGISTTSPTRRLDVNGVVGVYDNSVRTYNAGISTEQNGQLIQIGINDSSLNRFGGTYNLGVQGGMMRVDTRSGSALFQFLGRSASLGIPVNLLMTLTSSGNMNVAGTVTQNSDARFKTNIETVSGALEKMLRLRGVSYDWNQAAFPERTFDTRHQLGFIAQEVREVLPDVVSEDADGYLAVGYTAIMPVLAEAIKELKAQKDAEIATLREKITVLEARDAAREARLTRLEAAASPARVVTASLKD